MKKKILIIILLFSFLFLIPYTFSKYNTTLSNTIKMNFSRPQYTFHFDSNNGAGTMSDLSVKYGVSNTLTPNAFTRSGYDFIGWNTAADGSGVSYAAEQDVTYASITNGETITLYAQWFNKNYLNNSTVLDTYTCTENVDVFDAPNTGIYVLEAWGAQGGNVSDNIKDNNTISATEGGKGGYSYGIINLNAGDKVYVAVGCEGVSVENSPDGTIGAGGYNGGGRALVDGKLNYSGSGGGATHFAINHNLGELVNYVNNQSDVLLVAGGGGGAYNSTDIYYYSVGGYGGGLVAGDSVSYYVKEYRSNQLPNVRDSFVYYQGMHIPGANQMLQTGNDYTYGTFGKGVDAIREISGTDAGAGGGWYGGNRLIRPISSGGMAASGGSGHINTTLLSEGKTIAGNLQIPTHDSSSYMIGNSGDGYAKISYVIPHYTVKFDSNGGTGSMSDMDFAYGTAQNLTANAFTKDRFYFDGWNTRADGTGTSYTNGELVNNLSSTNGAEITLYAQWKTNYIYFQVPPDWDGNSVSVYLFNSSTNNTWPGYSATSIDASKNIFGYELSENDKQNYTSIIINSATGARQTVDLDYNNNLLGKVFVPKLYNSSTDIRVFFSGSAKWTPYIYLWNISSGSNNHAWPGLLMSGKISGSGYSEIITKSQYDKMIFNKGSGGVGNQTDDVNVPTYQDLTYKIARNGNSQSHEQTRFYYDGEWNEYDNWINSGYSVWYSGDYTKFQSAQSALGY